jgi:uncharacterized protein YrrD
MQFKKNAEVFTSDHQKVGEIDRVVIDPRTDEVTHVIVRKGLFFTKDKVVPVDLITNAKEDRVTLRSDMIDSLPDFEEHHFIMLDGDELPSTYSSDHAAPMYWYPLQSTDYQQIMIPPMLLQTERHIPEQTVALKEGATVISADGQNVGNIERIFVNPDTDRVMSFLVSKGLISKEKMLIPSVWVSRFGEHEVQLTVGSRLLEKHSQLLGTGQKPEEVEENLS